jgi:hypothetical protein
MPITITKPKTVVQTTETPDLLSEHAAKIDEMGKLQLDLEKAEAALEAKAKKELEKVTDLAAKLKKLKAELDPLLQAEADEYPDQTHTLKGTKFQADLGKKGTERQVADINLIHDILEEQEKGLFFKLASVKLGDLDQYLTPQEKEATIDTNRTKRTIKIVKRV